MDEVNKNVTCFESVHLTRLENKGKKLHCIIMGLTKSTDKVITRLQRNTRIPYFI